MKKTFLLIALLVAATTSFTANAELRFGAKAGVGLNTLSFDKAVDNVISVSNRTGFTGGVMLEWESPIPGLCIDGAAQYTHRSVDTGKGMTMFKRDYMSIPVNVKYKLNIVGIHQTVSPFVFTGPEFAFLVSKDNDGTGTNFSKTSASWNIGAGVELLRHLQVSVAYGMGLNKSIKNAFENVMTGGKLEQQVNGTDRMWTIQAAVLF